MIDLIRKGRIRLERRIILASGEVLVTLAQIVTPIVMKNHAGRLGNQRDGNQHLKPDEYPLIAALSAHWCLFER